MEQHELLLYVVACFEKLRIPYLITGSMASMAYGEPRFTNAIDIVADIKSNQVKAIKSSFPDNEFYLEADSIREALYRQQQFNIIHPASGLKIDVIISKHDEFDQSRFQRIKRLDVSENKSASFAAPEDVIIKKLLYYKEGGSEKHLRDITSILKISSSLIDQGYISSWVAKFKVEKIWEAVLKKISFNKQ